MTDGRGPCGGEARRAFQLKQPDPAVSKSGGAAVDRIVGQHAIGAEVLRVGNGHLSYRTERLPWRQYRPAIIATALGVFWLVAAVRVKTERVQAAERRGHVRH